MLLTLNTLLFVFFHESLALEENETTTEPLPCLLPEKLEDLNCYFLDQFEDDVESRLQLFERCLKERSGKKVILSRIAQSLMIDQRVCGVSNTSDLNSELCFVPVNSQARVFAHFISVNVSQEEYRTLYSNINHPDFLAKKFSLEMEMGTLILGHEILGKVFESVFITNLDLWLNENQNQLKIQAFLQFRSEIVQADLLQHWETLTNDKYSNMTIEQKKSCPKLKTLKKDIPKDFDIKSLDDNQELNVGDYFNLQCPEGLKLSFDNDSFLAWDDYFTVTCLPNQQYSVKYNWPRCVKACGTCLPDPPERTGLVPIQPNHQVPIGQQAKYICQDNSLGTDQGPSELYLVKCIGENTFEIPEEYGWPLCLPKTTTVPPVIPLAFNQTMERRVAAIYQRHQKKEFIDLSVKIQDPGSHFLTTTIPSVLGKRGCHRHRIWADLILITFSGLAVVIGIIFYLSNINSPLCRICGEATSRIDKRIFLLKNNGEDQKISNEA